MTNNSSNIVKQAVVPFILSDHDLVSYVRKINTLKYAPKIIDAETIEIIHLTNFVKA